MHYEKIKHEPTPCEFDDCPFGKPYLWPSNAFIWEMYTKVSGQVIVAGMGEVLGIKFEAIQFLFDLYELPQETRLETFEKILAIDAVKMKFRTEQVMKSIQNSKKKR